MPFSVPKGQMKIYSCIISPSNYFSHANIQKLIWSGNIEYVQYAMISSQKQTTDS